MSSKCQIIRLRVNSVPVSVSSAPSPDCSPPARLLGVVLPAWRWDGTSFQDVDQAGGHTGVTVPERQ